MAKKSRRSSKGGIGNAKGLVKTGLLALGVMAAMNVVAPGKGQAGNAIAGYLVGGPMVAVATLVTPSILGAVQGGLGSATGSSGGYIN